jgi:hypothetical protein
MTNCQDYLRLRPQGYEARTEVDFAAMKIEGSRCQALKALERAQPAARTPLRVLVDQAFLTVLPPALGPENTPVDLERRERATREGAAWKALDPDATITIRSPEGATVTGADWTTRVDVLARADFDGDGNGDLLVRTVSFGTEGSWREVRLRVLSRRRNSAVLAVTAELPL